MAAIFHRLQLTLFHAGRIDHAARAPTQAPVSVTGWATRRSGIRRHRPPLRRAGHVEPATEHRQDTSNHDLREFGTWLADTHPDVRSCADLDAAPHRGVTRRWLSTHPHGRYTGKPLNRISIKNALINLHCFFDRITEWGYPNPPQRPLIFAGDLPIVDKPLPRFLDDAAAAKLLRAPAPTLIRWPG